MRRLMQALLIGLVLVGGASTGFAQALQPPPAAGLKTAAFAGGCFWCMVHPFEELPGVSLVVSGYTGGTVANPSYEQVSSGTTGHRESVQVTYDPKVIDYQKLLQVFFSNIDPFDADGAFCDRGMQYTSAIFVADAEQRRLAEAALASVQERFGKAPATVILDAGPFYRAEDYHQDFYKKSPLHYRYYRFSCGRDARLDALWGKEARNGEPAP